MTNQDSIVSLDDNEILHSNGSNDSPIGKNDAIPCIETDEIPARPIAGLRLCQLQAVAIPGARIRPGEGRRDDNETCRLFEDPAVYGHLLPGSSLFTLETTEVFLHQSQKPLSAPEKNPGAP